MKKLILISTISLSLISANAFAEIGCKKSEADSSLTRCETKDAICYSSTVEYRGVISTSLSCFKK